MEYREDNGISEEKMTCCSSFSTVSVEKKASKGTKEEQRGALNKRLRACVRACVDSGICFCSDACR